MGRSRVKMFWDGSENEKIATVVVVEIQVVVQDPENIITTVKNHTSTHY